MKRTGGFTLIELMIVVVIIGILAAIAIPQFLKYQLKSKTSESPRNLASIYETEIIFAAKYASFALASIRPAGTPSSSKRAWGPSGGTSGFDMMGFAVQGSAYYSYSVATTSPTVATGVVDSGDSSISSFGALSGGVSSGPGIQVYIGATGDIDGDSVFGSFYVTDEDTEQIPVPIIAGELVF